MNSQPDRDLERRLKKLEAELDSPQPPYRAPKQFIQQTDGSQPTQLQNRLIDWFNKLSGFGKIIVVGVGTLVGLAILRAVLNIVASVVSLALIGVIVYLAYKFLLARSSKTNE